MNAKDDLQALYLVLIQLLKIKRTQLYKLSITKDQQWLLLVVCIYLFKQLVATVAFSYLSNNNLNNIIIQDNSQYLSTYSNSLL